MLALVAFRIILGYMIGAAWYGVSEVYDDAAMINGLSLERLTNPDHLSLIKDMSYTLFLGFSAITNLPYTIVLSAFWVLAAIIVWLAVGKMTKNKWTKLFAFSYVLFLPIAFTAQGGLRIYRNAIIPPFIIITLSLAFILIISLAKKEKLKSVVRNAVLTGLALAFTFFIKEDGIWLKASMLLITAICVAIVLYRIVKEKKKKNSNKTKQAIIWIAVCLIPFGILFVWDNVYRGVNHGIYGVYEINTRTEASLGKFVEKIYKIDSPNRTEIVWAPYDAIQAAFKVSPTLKSHPELLENIMTTPWYNGNIVENPINRDFLTWVLRGAIVDSGLWTSEKDVNEIFKQANNELDEAFKKGELKKAEGRIQILASTGGYSWDEIKRGDIARQIVMSLGDSLWFNNYNIGISESDIAHAANDSQSDFDRVNKVLHMGGSLNTINQQKQIIAKNIIHGIMWVYRIINTGLIIALFAFIIKEIIVLIQILRKKRTCKKADIINLSCAFASFVLFGMTIAYSFATAWFFISPIDKMDPVIYNPDLFVFYRVGVPALLTLAFLPTMIGLERWIQTGSKN